MNVNLVCVVEAGRIPANTKLSFGATAESPTGDIATSDPFDLSIEEKTRPVMRYALKRLLSFDVTMAGPWAFSIRSGAYELARIDVEFRVTNA